jgi:hypothetical protein
MGTGIGSRLHSFVAAGKVHTTNGNVWNGQNVQIQSPALNIARYNTLLPENRSDPRREWKQWWHWESLRRLSNFSTLPLKL